ncbi:MAG: hypothetical protein JW953_03390 [Anaerolineae bacterium]|nr:hypothetical protein [Anaerolineae bacterium]
MKNNADICQESLISEAINTLLDLLSGPAYHPEPANGDLYAERFILPRSFFGWGGQLVVPDASCVIIWGRRGFCHTFWPGVYSLRHCPAGRLDGRLVDMSQHSRVIELRGLYTGDLARISLQVDVEFKVDNPQAVIQLKSPTQTLTTIVESTVRQVIEKLPHCLLFGGANSTELTNKMALERQIRQSLHTEEALNGLRILSLKIIKTEGDPTYLTLTTKEVLAEQQLIAEKATLQIHQQQAENKRELTLFQAETERLATSTRQKVALDEAKRQALVFKLESTQRDFQRQMEEMRLVHEQTLARIDALSRAITAWGDPRHLLVSNGLYAQTNNPNGHEQTLSKMIDHLIEPQPTPVSAPTNGHGKHSL